MVKVYVTQQGTESWENSPATRLITKLRETFGEANIVVSNQSYTSKTRHEEIKKSDVMLVILSRSRLGVFRNRISGQGLFDEKNRQHEDIDFALREAHRRIISVSLGNTLLAREQNLPVALHGLANETSCRIRDFSDFNSDFGNLRTKINASAGDTQTDRPGKKTINFFKPNWVIWTVIADFVESTRLIFAGLVLLLGLLGATSTYIRARFGGTPRLPNLFRSITNTYTPTVTSTLAFRLTHVPTAAERAGEFSAVVVFCELFDFSRDAALVDECDLLLITVS